ncbi:MAG: DUF2950 family protein, partial [Planctomycetota bacterium]
MSRGFTLIELMIVIAIIAIIAAIAVPNLISARLSSNETAAVATLRTIITAQSQFQTTARADENLNGLGEYGTFGEMSASVGVRGGARLSLPVISTAFRAVNASGQVPRSGYLFAIYLPDAAGDPVPEDANGGMSAGQVDPALAESTWCCYGWPGGFGSSGARTFFVNQAGDIVQTLNSSYTGSGSGPGA